MKPGRAFTEDDRWLLAEGRHDSLYEVLGSHVGPDGTVFRVWAPNAASVAVVGDFNGWDGLANPMKGSNSGVWEGFVPGLGDGQRYKYHLVSQLRGYVVDKSDPFAVHAETSPATASIVWSPDYEWMDGEWMAGRGARHQPGAPISIYEVHLGSWRHHGQVGYRSIAAELAEYVAEAGFTHVELMPVMEHPYYASWGYQVTGYFAATSRYGPPEDLMYLIDYLHRMNIGVLLDWVPSHFPSDEHGLAFFDGTHLYEHADPRLGYHPDWNSLIFNYDRKPVRSFLRSSAHFWVDRFHADGLRVDAVASMLYLDYSRKEGEWIPNRYGGRENLGAVEFLREVNGSITRRFPDAMVVAEESTSWPKVTAASSEGGLGFSYKWDMGWMNDTLRYLRLDPLFRSHIDNHRSLTFRSMYAWSERFVLSLSHDEVVHGKGSLLSRQQGDEWKRFAALRALFGFQWGQPGKKLIFMGGEIGQTTEWNHDSEVPFGLLQYPLHAGVLRWVTRLNQLLGEEPALHVYDDRPDGFAWVEADDASRSTYAFLRRAGEARPVLVVANFTALSWKEYRLGVPVGDRWIELANSDSAVFGGSGVSALLMDQPEAVPSHGYAQSLVLTVPPLGVVFLAPAAIPEGDIQ